MLYGLERYQHESLRQKETRGRTKDLRVPVLSQPSWLRVWVGDSHLDLQENGRNAIAWKPTVGSEEVHAN